MRGSFPDAQVGADITPEDRFYANRVDVERHLATENWSMWHLIVNANVSYVGSSPDSYTKRQRELLSNISVAIPMGKTGAEKNVLRVKSGDREIMTLDISKINDQVRENQSIRVFFGQRFSEIIVLAVTKDYDGPLPRFLGAEDLNPDGLPACPQTYTQYYTDPKVQCQRPEGHAGNHQFFMNGRYGNFNAGGSSASPCSVFGLPAYCQHCGFMVASDGQSEVTCSSCAHWLRLLTEYSDEQRFVINGIHYMPGQGGFYGRQFNIRKQDGTLWTGELFTQGTIPDHMRDRFPDNATFEN